MEKKNTILCLILVAIIVGCAVAAIIFSGITAKEYNYVQIEVNPRAEFLCDQKFKVVSIMPLNDDAKIVLSDINLIGLNIDEATNKFLHECARTGYLDVNGVDNAVNITVIDGLTQALDVRVTQSVYNFMRQNEIMGAVTETYEDRHMFDEKKKNDVCCSNKYKLILTMSENDSSYKIETLKKMSEQNLIDIVADKHKNSPYTPTNEHIQAKQQLINNNQHKYNTHQKSITSNTQKEFATLFDKFQKLSLKKYTQDFYKQYAIWQNNKPL